MPEIEALRERFFAYVDSFYTENEADNRAIQLKREHTRRVCRNARMLANKLEISEKDAALAEIMALLHDIGRFRQYRQYRSFRDADTENHAVLGVREIQSHAMVDGLSAEDSALVLEAVRLHNVFAIPAEIAKRQRFFLELLRDADKLDIWKVFGEYYEHREAPETESVALGLPDSPGCSKAALDAVVEGRLVRVESLRNLNDFKLLQVSWVYDLNFAPSVCAMLEKGHLDRLRTFLPDTPEIREAFDRVFLYAEAASAKKSAGDRLGHKRR